MDAYGILPERLAGSTDDAVAAARELGYPAVVKSGAPGAHKTESGGVALDLGDDDAVRVAAERIGLPLIVQPMLLGGTEPLAASCRIRASARSSPSGRAASSRS